MSAVSDFTVRRFQSAAAHYLAGRPAYPEALIARVAEMARLERGHRLLDLGCGPGQLALAFAPRVRQVVAMDPEPVMLELARQGAQAHANVEVVQGGSNDLGAQPGRFQVVTIGRAFHWMDREKTLLEFDRLIEPGGAVALFGEEHPDIPENSRIREYGELLQAWSKDDSSHVIRSGAGYHPTVSVLLASPFSRLERIVVVHRQRLSLETLVDRALSLSSTSRARLGDRADELIAELTARMAQWETQGPMEEVLASQALVAWRP